MGVRICTLKDYSDQLGENPLRFVLLLAKPHTFKCGPLANEVLDAALNSPTVKPLNAAVKLT